MPSAAASKCSYRQKVRSKAGLQLFINKVTELFEEHKYLNCFVSDLRSLDQNALAAVWYHDIAQSREGVTAQDVKRECKVNYAINILRRSEQHDWMFRHTLDKMNYEQKLRASDLFAMTSIMSTEQMHEYLTCMEIDYPWLESVKKNRKSKA